MRLISVCCVIAIFLAAGLIIEKAGAEPRVLPASVSRFEIRDGKFLLDGKPFVILSGEMHYPRIPQQYWRHRLRMAKAMGLNTVTTYVFWNVHETEKGKFNFSGEADLVKFIKMAQEEGLYVLLRPGPYVCAEWEFGGFPYWLLTEKDCVIRANNPVFLKYAARYLKEVGKRCAPLQAGRGGNILMVQVENEYGSYGQDNRYMSAIRDLIRKAGFTVPLFTADGPSQMKAGHIDGALPALNGAGSGNLQKTIDVFQPGGPYFAPEIYPGWLDHWGEPFVRSNTASDVRTLEWFVQNGHSLSLYMFHGGTNFGFWNGANFGGNYEPHITSYDYDAPLDEAGRPTDEYNKMREALVRLLPAGSVPPVPAPNPVITVPRFELTEKGTLLAALPRPVHSEKPKTMEELGQGYGYILYRTSISGPVKDKLTLKSLRDYALVLVDGSLAGTLDRRRRQQFLPLDLPGGSHTLDILVENGGRINYGSLLTDNRKGITESVLLGETPLEGWDIFSLPFDSPGKLTLDGKTGNTPMLYRGQFSLDTVGDTFLDMRGWTKGAVWINGHALGRYWNIGPQQTLYVPGPWLRKGQNEVEVFEMLGTKSPTLSGLNEPILDRLMPEPPIASTHPTRPAYTTLPTPTPSDLKAQGNFSNPDTTQTVPFSPVKARYVCFESTSNFEGNSFASCAEFLLLDRMGKPLPRGSWRVLSTDGEESAAEDGSAENMIDGDDTTYWHSLWSQSQPGHPHRVVLDLGDEREFSAFRYVPRMGMKPGKVKGYRFYASNSPFGAR